MLRDAEKKCLQDWRKTLLQDLSGDVIELDTEENILQAGFAWQKITRQSIRGVPPVARPGIWGEAIKL